MFDAYLLENPLKPLLAPPSRRIPFPSANDRARWNAVSDEARAQVLAAADKRLNQGYPALAATQFMAYVRTGNRRIFEAPYFERRTHLLVSALAECLTMEGKYLDDVIDGLFYICEETFWGVSAHNGSNHPGVRPMRERLLPDAENPYIDLFAAQTASTVAWVYYLLRDQLDAVSPIIARRVRAELKRRIFDPFMFHDDFWWMGMIRRDLNNWTPWIVSNVMDAMRLCESDDTRLCEGFARALRMLDRYLDVMPQDGGCDEGVGYWNVAGGSLLCCLEHLYDATEGRVSFFDQAHIRAILAYPTSAHIAGTYYINFADCDAQPMLDGERIYRAGEYTQNDALMQLGMDVASRETTILPVDTPESYRVLCKMFRPIPAPVQPLSHGDRQLENLQVGAWTRNGLQLIIKGGHNAESHSHNDVGTFILFDGETPAVIDVGNMVYTAQTFDPATRYTLFNTRSANHNLPLIGGIEQHEGITFCARDVEFHENGMSLDIAPAYPAQAGIKSLCRSALLTNEGLTLRDRIDLSDEKPVTWVFMLRQAPTVHGSTVDFGALRLTFPEGLHAQWEEIPITDARMARNFPGSVYRLTLEAAPNKAFDASFVFAHR